MQTGAFLTNRVAGTTIPSLVVGTSRDGERAIASGGRVPATESSPYRIASLTKPFTSAAVVLSFAARRIPLSAPAIDLIPALAPDWHANPAITVEQLRAQGPAATRASRSPAGSTPSPRSRASSATCSSR